MKTSKYIITLDKFKTREKIQNDVILRSLNPKIILGVDGSKLSNKDIRNNCLQFFATFGPNSVIGCAMAHIKAWKRFLKSKSDYVLIMEDDVYFSQNVDLDMLIKNTPSDFDILYLGGFFSNHTRKDNIIQFLSLFGIVNGNGNGNGNIKIPLISLGCHAYIVSRQGVYKLLKELENKIFNHIDFCIQYLVANNKLKVYSLDSRIAFQTSTTSVSSNTNNFIKPRVLDYLLNNIKIDDCFHLNYFFFVKFLKIPLINLEINLFLIIVLLLLLLDYQNFIILFLLFIPNYLY